MMDEECNEERSLMIEVERLKAQLSSPSRRSSREGSRSSSPRRSFTSPTPTLVSAGGTNGQPGTPMTPEQHRIMELEAKVAQDAFEMEQIQVKIAAMQKKALDTLSQSETARVAAEKEVGRLRAIRQSERAKAAKISITGPATLNELAAREERVMALERALARRDDEIKLLTVRLGYAQGGEGGSKPSSPEVGEKNSSPNGSSSGGGRGRRSSTVFGGELEMNLRKSVTTSAPPSDLLSSRMKKTLSLQAQIARERVKNAQLEVEVHEQRRLLQQLRGHDHKAPRPPDTGAQSKPPHSSSSRSSGFDNNILNASVKDLFRSSSPEAAAVSSSREEPQSLRFYLDVGASKITLGVWDGNYDAGIRTLYSVPTYCASVEGGPQSARDLFKQSGLASPQKDGKPDPILVDLFTKGVVLGDAAVTAKYGGGYPKIFTDGLIMEYPMRELTAIDAAHRGGVPTSREAAHALEAKYKLHAGQLLEECFRVSLDALDRASRASARRGMDVVVVHNGGLPRPILEVILEYLFETLGSPWVGFLDTASLLCNSIVGVGESALVVDVGCYRTHTMPIVEGVLNLESVDVVEVGGETGTARMLELLEVFCRDSPRGAFAAESPDRREYLARNAKDTVGFVSDENNKHHDDDHNTNHRFSWCTATGSTAEMLLKEECFLCVEDVVKELAASIVRMASGMEEALREDVTNHIIVTGGTARMRGLRERLLKMVHLRLTMLGVEHVEVTVDTSDWSSGTFNAGVWRALEEATTEVTSEEYFSHSAGAES